MQTQRQFDQAGCTGCALGVPDLRFDTTERSKRLLIGVGTQHLSECCEFGLVADCCTGGVCLEQFDRRRLAAGIFVRTLERHSLAIGVGSVDAVGSSVTR